MKFQNNIANFYFTKNKKNCKNIYRLNNYLMAIYQFILVKRLPECVPTTFRAINYISFKKIRKN